MHQLNKKSFFIASVITACLAIIILTVSFLAGKQEFFLELNFDAGRFADNFFAIATHGGEEWGWISLLLITLFVLKRKDAILLLVGALLFSTLIVQVFKNFILPGEPRPTKAIGDMHLIHTVEGVYLNTINSFPSGHTTSAFCIYLTLCLLIKRSWVIVAGLVFALLVGYSRVYLAEHFPLDVAGGMIAAIISVWLAKFVQEQWWKKIKRKPATSLAK